jgi:hypothetical protein
MENTLIKIITVVVQFRNGLREIIKDAHLENKIHVHSTHPGLTATPLFDISKGLLSMACRSIKASS